MDTDIRRVIVDVDVGTDDYMALLILLVAEITGMIKIEALLCSMGNSRVDCTCKNLVRLLETVNRTDIPIYKGAQDQLIIPFEPVPPYHGVDGFGDLKHDKEPDVSIIKSTPSSVALGQIIMNNPNDITLICLGPLTNLAMAIRMYDGLLDNLKEHWIMGGNYKGVGNISPYAEYNFYVDPEAAYMVLNATKQPVHLMPWETCLSSTISMDWRLQELNDTAALALLTRAEEQYESEYWITCDSFAAFAFVNPEMYITKQCKYYATVELHNSTNRGEVLLDQAKEPNVIIIENVDQDLFREAAVHTKIIKLA